MSSNRTDAHSPANLVTEDYDFAALVDHDHANESEGYAAQARAALTRRLLEEGYSFASVHPSAQCDHCGARLRYAAYLIHRPTGKIVEVGETCLDNRFALATAEFQKLRKEAKLDRERQARIEAVADFARTNPDLAFMADADFEHTNNFIEDVSRKLRIYGSLSDNQIGAVRRVLDQIAEREANPVEKEIVAPVIEGKIVLTGKVLSTKVQYGDFGATLKMLVRDDRGFKVWGTVPNSLPNIERGDRITFSATVTASADDENFGFFKRPTKATYIDQEGN